MVWRKIKINLVCCSVERKKKIIHPFCLHNFWLQEPWQGSPVSQSPADSYQDSSVEMTECFFQETSSKTRQNLDPGCSVSFAMCLMCSSCSYSPAVTIPCLLCPHPRAASTNPAGAGSVLEGWELCAGILFPLLSQRVVHRDKEQIQERGFI